MAFNPSNVNWAALAGLSSGNNVGEQFGNMNAVIASQQPLVMAQLERKQTYQYLQNRHPDIAEAVRSGAMPLSMAWEKAQLAEQPKKPNLLSAGNGMFYDVDAGKYITPPAEMAQNQNEYGLNPIWVQDPTTGQQKLMVTSKDGTTKILDTQGLNPVSPLKAIDTGTGTMLVDPRTARPNTTIQKDLAGAKEQELAGKNIAEIKATLPSARLTARQISDQIAAVKGDSALSSAVGTIDSRLPTLFPSTARVEAKIEQLRGGAFLQARELLRGGGQITDYEGQKAEAAIARLNTAQSEEDFKAALDDFNNAVQEGLAKLEAVAAGNTSYNANPPPSGNIDSLVEKYRTK